MKNKTLIKDLNKCYEVINDIRLREPLNPEQCKYLSFALDNLLLVIDSLEEKK